MLGDIFGHHKLGRGAVRGAAGIQCQEARDAGDQPTMYRAASVMNNYPTQSANTVLQ